MTGGLPLHRAVEEYLSKGRARFHMPGHKGEGPWLRWDITEVEGCDSLYQPQGAILELERWLSSLYGSRWTLLSAGGATLCIQAMLALACPPGKKLVAGRGLHRSAVNAMALLDLEPVWIYPDQSAGPWFAGRYTPQAVEAALDACPEAAAVYLTSPDYFGVISDLTGVAQVCRRRGVPLLVDNAHGAHLKFLPPQLGLRHPLDCGASLCSDSLHKTMPAMTGGALLQVGEEGFLAQAKGRMALFGSTSPSYPILLSCERAAEYAASGRAQRDFGRVASLLARLEALCRQRGLPIPEGPRDPARLSVAFGAQGWTPKGFGAHLRRYGVEPEYLSRTACVLMATGFNRPEEFARLERALVNLPGGQAAPPPSQQLPRLERACSIRQAIFSPWEEIPVGAAAGRVAGEECSPCPPGAPVVMPGERLDGGAAELLAACGVQTLRVLAE